MLYIYICICIYVFFFPIALLPDPHGDIANTRHMPRQIQTYIEFPRLSSHSAHSRFRGPVSAGVEFNTQRCGKPLMPRVPAPLKMCFYSKIVVFIQIQRFLIAVKCSSNRKTLHNDCEVTSKACFEIQPCSSGTSITLP